MKLPIAIASLFLATTIALPAFAAIPHRAGHTAHASHDSVGGSSSAVSRQIIPGWRCVSRDLGEGNYSAYPAWEVCD